MMKRTFVFLLLVAGMAFATRQSAPAQSAVSLGYEKTYSSIKGGFDGTTSLMGSVVGFLVPKFTPAWGNKYWVGIRMHNSSTTGTGLGYYKLTYSKVVYPSAHSGISIGDATFSSFGIEYLVTYPGTKDNDDTKLPFLQIAGVFGMELGTIKAEHTYISSLSMTIGEASKFAVIEIPVGVGICINPFNFFSIDVSVCHKFGSVTSVRKADASNEEAYELEDNMWAGGFFMQMGISLNIPVNL